MQSINGNMLNKTEKLYEEFLLFSDKLDLNIEVKGDKLPIYPQFNIQKNKRISQIE